MPTSVSTVRQCLANEAAHALDEAVMVASRRGHAQTTSLHLVSSLLSLPSSPLREACSRTRNNAYSMRIQFKALELCLAVSLDRLPSAPSRVEEPPVSNSLMAAIKRSQANQRRQPENFSFYQQQLLSSSSSSSVSVVKVELRNLILSILDDPVVSRVFGEAGFSSCEIKIAILRPVQQLFRYSKSRWPRAPPPLFLCNLNDENHLDSRSFSFPFTGFSEFLDGEENCRRIGEVMERNGRRNALLVGVCASDSLRNFLGMLQRRRGRNELPVNLSGLGVISVEDEILRFVSGNCEECSMKLRFQEVGRVVDNCVGPGVVVSFGDLKALAGDDASFDALWCIVCELTKLLEVHGRKVWLIGSVAAYEIYLKFSKMFPSAEKDLGLHLLPITTVRFPKRKSYPRSSLMESFVPFGGFFSTPDVKSTLSSSLRRQLRCHLCNEKCRQEVNALSDGRVVDSVAEAIESNFPLPLHVNESNTDGGLHLSLAPNGRELLSAKIARLYRKWDNICQSLHCGQEIFKANNYKLSPQAVAGLRSLDGEQANEDSDSIYEMNASLTNNGWKDAMSLMLPDAVASGKVSPTSLLPKISNMNFQVEFNEIPSEAVKECAPGSSCNSSESSPKNDLESPASVTTITIDLNVELNTASTSTELGKPIDKNHVNLSKNFSSHHPVDCRNLSRMVPSNEVKSSCSPLYSVERLDQRDFKMLYTALAKRIGWQEEAVKAISETIAHCRTTNDKDHNCGAIWFCWLGSDQLGKKKLAIALAEILYGTRDSVIHVDLSFQEYMSCSKAMFDLEPWDSYHVIHRGKTIVDYIAEKLRNRPLSVVLLEKIHKADLLLQQSLSQAVKTGRFPDSHGREVRISNTIFVTTSQPMESARKLHSETADYSEEDVSSAKAWPIRIIIGIDLCDNLISSNASVPGMRMKSGSNRIFVNKRKYDGENVTVKQICYPEVAKRVHRALDANLDLNIPAEDGETSNECPGNSANDSTFENSTKWLEDFLGKVHAKVVFQRFDFDALANSILQVITDCFQKTLGSECSMEIEYKVMMQMVAAAYVTSDKLVEDWIHRVLIKGFEEAKEKYSLTSCSILKLVACEGIIAGENTSAGVLPSRIIVN